MKLYVANITQSEKMVYLSCIRNVKENGKFNSIPITVSVKKENYHVKITKFPLVVDAQFIKGTGAIVKNYEEVQSRN